MNVNELLYEIEEVLEEALAIPLSGGKRVVDVEKVREIVDDVRLNLPGEIKQAMAIVQDRADIVASAKKEAENIIKRAEDRARVLVSESEIVKQTQARATDIMATAQQQAREMRGNVTDYCENMLKRTEEVLVHSAQDVKNVRLNLRQTAKNNK